MNENQSLNEESSSSVEQNQNSDLTNASETEEDPQQSGHLDNLHELSSNESEYQSEKTPAEYEIIIAQLENQLNEANDKLVRAIAETENVKKRAQKDLENAHKFAIDSLLKELISVLDSFDGAKQTLANTHKEATQGIIMIETNFLQTLQKHGVEVIQPNHGDDFNPENHQAMSMQENENFEANKIINVFQKGFAIKGRLIRPAMVVVSS